MVNISRYLPDDITTPRSVRVGAYAAVILEDLAAEIALFELIFSGDSRRCSRICAALRDGREGAVTHQELIAAANAEMVAWERVLEADAAVFMGAR